MTNEKKFHVGVKALILNEEGKILVIKANPDEHQNKKYGAYWDLPGGRIKEGDNAEETLRLELDEELGYEGKIKNLKLFHGSISNIEIPVDDENYGLVLFVYTCDIDDEDFALSEEHTEYKWTSVEEAKKLLSVKFPRDFVEKLDELVKSPVSDAGE